MKIQYSFALLMLFGSIVLQSCGGNDKEKETATQNDQMVTIESENEEDSASITIESDDVEATTKEALRQLREGNLEAKEVVAYQSLKDLLPPRVLGMKRTHLEGQKSGMEGLQVAVANATYQENDKEINISIVDAGGSALTLAGLAMWANMEFERESDDGYERTTRIEGYKAFEQYDKNAKSGQLSVLVDDRFVINIEGDNVAEKDLRKVLDDINLRQLSRLQ